MLQEWDNENTVVIKQLRSSGTVCRHIFLSGDYKRYLPAGGNDGGLSHTPVGRMPNGENI